jgi:hypothetical protein
MIPRYGEWDQKLRSEGLTVIGVHSPETDGERDQGRLVAYLKKERIKWRVAVDADFEIWRRFEIEAWPTILLIDRQGMIRSTYVGDDQAGQIEADLRRLMAAQR